MVKLYILLNRCRKTNSIYKFLLLILAILYGTTTNVNAQVSAYTFAQSVGTFTPITGTVLGTATGNTTTTNLNSNVYPVILPFNFIFNGVSYNSLNVSTNGFISFGITAPGTTVTAPISSTTTTAYDGAVSAFGRDLSSVFDVNGITGNISWEIVGTAPNREVVIQWKDFRPASSVSVTAVYTFSFHIRLQETTNKISVVYSAGSNVTGTTSSSSTAKIGLRGISIADFNTRLNASTVDYNTSTAGTANTSSQSYSTVNAVPGMPVSGLTYVWTPPTCWSPLAVTVNSITTTSALVNWTAPATAPGSGYDVYYSTSSTSPTSTTAPNQSGVTALTASLNPL